MQHMGLSIFKEAAAKDVAASFLIDIQNGFTGNSDYEKRQENYRRVEATDRGAALDE
jgi:hypothetical protein